MSRWLLPVMLVALVIAGCGGPGLDESVNTYRDENSDVPERVDAVQNITATGDSEAVDVLIEALGDEAAAVRAAAAGGLGYYLEERAVDPLIDTLDDKNPEVREAAVRSLVLYGDEAVDELIRALRVSDDDNASAETVEAAAQRRDSIAKVLVSIGRPAVDAVRERLVELQLESFKTAARVLTNPALNLDINEELAAVYAEDEIDTAEDYAANPTDSVSRFLKRIANELWTPREYLILSLEALEITPPTYLETVRGDDEGGRILELTNAAFDELGLSAINPLIQMRETNTLAAQLMSTHYMGHVGGPEATEVLIGILDERSDYATKPVKLVALESLGTIGSGGAISVLFQTIRKPDLQEKAAEQIERIGVPAVEYVEARLLDDDPKIRAVAIWFFSQTDNRVYQEIGLEALLENLVVPVRVLRENAALALSTMPELAFEPVSELVESEDPDIREAAALCLGNMDTPRVRPLLEQLATDSSGQVKSAADEGLKILESKGY